MKLKNKITKKIRSLSSRIKNKRSVIERSTYKKASSLSCKDKTIPIMMRGKFNRRRRGLKRYLINGDKKYTQTNLSIKNVDNKIVSISSIPTFMKYRYTMRKRYERFKRIR